MDSKLKTELVKKAIAGDNEAFSRLYLEHRDGLIKFVLKQGSVSHEDAEDIVSEAFTRAAAKIGELREPARFSTWLHGIAKNCYYETVKKENKLQRVIEDSSSEETDDSIDEADDTIMLPDDYAENEEIKQLLAETILSMKQEFQDVIYLKYYEEMYGDR